MPSSATSNRRGAGRQSTDSNSYAEQYFNDENQQQLIPPPPIESENTAVNYLVKKFGWYILVIMFPYIFGPIIALKNAYSRSKRTYMAARFAHEEGYTSYIWSYLPIGFTQLVITAVWTVSLGKYDLTDFFERGVASSPQRRYNLRRRNQETDSDVWDQDYQERQNYGSQERLIPEEDEAEVHETRRRPEPTGIFAPIIRLWRFLHMCVNVFFLGIYAIFGWTFGRLVEEDGKLVKKKYSRRSRSRNGSIRSGTTNAGAEDETYGIAQPHSFAPEYQSNQSPMDI